MLSIGSFAKLANVTPRTVRHYESVGLLPKPSRSANNYRCYDRKLLEQMLRIRDLQSLGFGLEEVKKLLRVSAPAMHERLRQRLVEVQGQLQLMQELKRKLEDLLSVSDKVESGITLTTSERTLYMEALEQEIIQGLNERYGTMSPSEADLFRRDFDFYARPQMTAFFAAVKKCLEFARQKGFRLGPCRGGTSASVSFFGLGLTHLDPAKNGLIPERLQTHAPYYHIDVEFERGQEFVDYCREVNKTLEYGEIQAFKMPLLDIVKNVEARLETRINFANFADDSDVVLNHFRKADIQRIFQFDFSAKALVMRFEDFLPGYQDTKNMTEFLRGQTIRDFRDVLNITALWRPFHPEMIERIESYKQAKTQPFAYSFLSPTLQEKLAPNYGRIVYHEDLLHVLASYLEGDFVKANRVRRLCLRGASTFEREQSLEWAEFLQNASPEVVDLVLFEGRCSFCLPHALSFGEFTKQTAILKSLHRDLYFAETECFEQKHGVTWDDIGLHFKGVSLHQN